VDWIISQPGLWYVARIGPPLDGRGGGFDGEFEVIPVFERLLQGSRHLVPRNLATLSLDIHSIASILLWQFSQLLGARRLCSPAVPLGRREAWQIVERAEQNRLPLVRRQFRVCKCREIGTGDAVHL